MKRFIFIGLVIGLLIFSCHQVTERLEEYSVQGIDVSHHQGKILWDSVATDEIQFAFVKATEGGDHIDSLFAKNWSELKRVGIKRGAYHFFQPDISPKEQASNFISNVRLEPGDLAPVVDVEILGNAKSRDLVKNLEIWLQLIENNYGVKPLIYSNQKFFLKHLRSFANRYPTWVARYNHLAPEVSYKSPWDFWQYGNKGQVSGIKGDVDLNVFRGEFLELEQYCLTESDGFSFSN